MKPEPKPGLWPLFLLLALFLLGSLIILPLPMLRDQGIYAYVAWNWVNDRIPYRDAFEHKGPLLYAVYAAALTLSRGAMWGPNLADILARGATVLLAYWCAAMVFDRRSALFAAFFTALPLFAVFNSCWWNAEAETFILPLLPLSLGLALQRFGSARFLAGVVAAQAVALKPTALLHALFLVFPASTYPVGKKGGLIFIAGVLCGLLPWVLYFAGKGALSDLYAALYVFNRFHAGLAPGMDWSRALALAEKDAWRVFGLLLIFGGAGVLSGRRRLLVLGYTAAALAQVVLQAKFFFYHWLILIPPAALLAASGLRFVEENFHRVVYYLALAIVLAQTLLGLRFYALLQMHYQTPRYLLGVVDRDQYYARFREPGTDFNFYATWHAADYLRHHTDPGEKVLVFGYEPGLNYLAARFAPTRFHSDYPLTFTPRSEEAERWRETWRRIFMADLRRRPPGVIILVTGDTNAIEPEDSLTQAKAFTEFWDFFEENYQPWVTIEDFHFYQDHAHRLSD
jgi:hypothetical protein